MEQIVQQNGNIDWTKLANIISSIIKAVAAAAPQSWWVTLLSTFSLVLATGLIVWFRIMAKKAAIDAANKDSEIGYQNQIDNRLPQNQTNNEKDEQNRNNLDNMN